ncbi:hypothetical protein SFA35_25150 (plasmid) [Pseudomonas sp. HR96]|uniref:hypothetical protein n=1 Tax=Pseudomonas sp. HR96 TaxID=1027966 RepID=UPI002A753456|nr:hypothetical protein [Pseudomonas sp. HR96]WPP02457.1 hypothetical protein SFA35_25150 [Pseudomonas sp. HR96]
MIVPSRIPPPFDHLGLPVELPDFVYATWVACVDELRTSKKLTQAEQLYQFCYGYVQALDDARVIDERYSCFLKVFLQDTWVELLDILP